MKRKIASLSLLFALPIFASDAMQNNDEDQKVRSLEALYIPCNNVQCSCEKAKGRKAIEHEYLLSYFAKPKKIFKGMCILEELHKRLDIKK